MNGSTNGFLQMSNGLSPHDNEDSRSIFFESVAPILPKAELSQASASSQSQKPMHRGGVRVSLACIPVSCTRPFERNIA